MQRQNIKQKFDGPLEFEKSISSFDPNDLKSRSAVEQKLRPSQDIFGMKDVSNIDALTYNNNDEDSIDYQSALDSGFQIEDNQEAVGSYRYQLTLKIHYETKFGEYLCVTGDIDELGNWENFICKLKWTEGHIWTTEAPIKTNKPVI